MSRRVRCIDASLAIKWFLTGEPYRRTAINFLNDSLNAGIYLIAPPLFEMEVDSIVQTRLFEQQITIRGANKILASLEMVPLYIETHPDMRLLARRIARQFNQPKVYDATYAALAQLNEGEFWTADRTFYEAVWRALPFVRYLPDYR